jgi:HTH-type transcriptional regulator / antitoxin HigA
VTIRPIRNEADYDAALKRIDQLFAARKGSKDGDRLEVMLALVAAYEAKHWPIDPPDPIDAIRFRMQQAGYTQSDLAKLLGSRSRASEVMRRRRPLTMRMAWRLNREWGIPAESLIRPYRIAA